MRIAILAYQDCLGTQLFGVADVLRIAQDVARAQGQSIPPLTLDVVGVSGRTVQLAGGTAVGVRKPAGKYDVLVVPGFDVRQGEAWDERLADLAAELAFIRKCFGGGSAVASVCVGSFLLGQAGLLAGRCATTSWLFAPELGRRHRTARIDGSAMLIEDGAVTTTGAVSAVFDLALHLAKRRFGAGVASATAKLAVLSPQRASQAPFHDLALAAPALPAFSHSLSQWFAQRLQQPYDLERVAQAFHVSARTLLRRVKAETGGSPLRLLQQARVARARQLLSETAWSVARITTEVGYADTATFARLFVRLAGCTPAQQRRTDKKNAPHGAGHENDIRLEEVPRMPGTRLLK